MKTAAFNLSGVIGLCMASLNVGRLSTPDTMAGPMEYGLWCGIPILAAVGLFTWGTRYKAPATPATTLDPCLKSLGQAASQLVAKGDTEAARKLLDAADVAQGKKKP